MGVDSADTNEEDRDARLKGEDFWDDFFQIRDRAYNRAEKNRYEVFRTTEIKGMMHLFRVI